MPSTNAERAERAAEVLVEYAQSQDLSREEAWEDLETVAVDLMTDLMHAAAFYHMDLDGIFRVSRLHFREESAGRE